MLVLMDDVASDKSVWDAESDVVMRFLTFSRLLAILSSLVSVPLLQVDATEVSRLRDEVSTVVERLINCSLMCRSRFSVLSAIVFSLEFTWPIALTRSYMVRFLQFLQIKVNTDKISSMLRVSLCRF